MQHMFCDGHRAEVAYLLFLGASTCSTEDFGGRDARPLGLNIIESIQAKEPTDQIHSSHLSICMDQILVRQTACAWLWIFIFIAILISECACSAGGLTSALADRVALLTVAGLCSWWRPRCHFVNGTICHARVGRLLVYACFIRHVR